MVGLLICPGTPRQTRNPGLLGQGLGVAAAPRARTRHARSGDARGRSAARAATRAGSTTPARVRSAAARVGSWSCRLSGPPPRPELTCFGIYWLPVRRPGDEVGEDVLEAVSAIARAVRRDGAEDRVCDVLLAGAVDRPDAEPGRHQRLQQRLLVGERPHAAHLAALARGQPSAGGELLQRTWLRPGERPRR